MKIARRFVKNELGATLPLAMMMIVIIGVMGAGLLTFVSTDLNSVIETNRGQRALELADAGVAAAKRQLSWHCGQAGQGDADCGLYYDGVGTDDIQWSADEAQNGMTLTDLDGSATTPNEVNVTIEYRDDTADFKIISTGYYGVAKRKVEAIFEGVITFGGGAGGYPLYYTPSDVKIKAEDTNGNPPRSVLLRDISVFAGGDILVQGLLSRTDFKTEMGDSNNQGRLTNTGKSDALQDWCTTIACGTKAFKLIPGPWNTQEREENKTEYNKHKTGDDLLEPGLAAVGRICGFADAVANDPVADAAVGKCASSPTPASIADGVYGYDCTTGLVPQAVTGCPEAPQQRGNGLTFVDKEPDEKTPNDAGTITFPFPRPEPDPETLHENAFSTFECPASSNCTPPWSTLIGGKGDIVFVDANKSTVNLAANGTEQGILVVWCGHLVQQSKFQGVIMNLNGKYPNGDGTNNFGGSDCTEINTGGPDMTKGTFRNAGNVFSGWLYAEGGTDQMAGIVIDPGSQIEKFPGGKWSFEMEALANAPPNSFALRSWRELYE
jgi:hypothetical protein